MGKNLLFIVGLSVLVSQSLAGDVILSREFPSCGYVGGQIYCYGGDTASSGARAIDTNIYSLNIVQFSGQKTDVMSNKWETIKPTTPFDTETRRVPTAMVLSDKKRFLIQGGENVRGTKYINQTIIYDTSSNSWQKSEPYSEANRGTRQMSFASVVSLPNNQIGFYGGFEELANISIPHISASGVTIPYRENNKTVVGFDRVKAYSPDSAVWSTFNPQINAPENYFPNSQTATFDPVSGKVYYLGGSYYTPESYQVAIRSPFDWGYTFNTKSGSWQNETFGGDIPSIRIYFSADLLPNSRDIILYGGTKGGGQGQVSVDYCYTLNLESNAWTKQNNVNVPSTLSGPRYAHSSVLVNTTLFILFGRGMDSNLNPSMLTIDVANVANISYTDVFKASSDAIVPPSNNATNTTSNTPTPPTSGLSGGAIGGIVAGIVVVVLAILAFVVYRIRSKRKAEKHNDATEQISVDWDKIDEQYKEIPAVSSTVTGSPHSPQQPLDTTRTDTSSPEVASTLRSQYTPKLVNTNVMADSMFSFDREQKPIQYPNVADPIKPSVDSADRGHTLVKPDISSSLKPNYNE